MKKDTTRKIKQLKHKSIWGPILSLLFSTIFGTIFMCVLLISIIVSVVENRFFESSRQSIVVKDTINQSIERGESIEQILESMQMGITPPLAVNIFDENGELIEAYGEEVSADISGVDFEAVKLRIRYTQDYVSHFVISGYSNNQTKDEDVANNVEIDIPLIIQNFFRGISKLSVSDDTTTIYTYEVYRFAYWIRLDLDKVDKQVCIKYEQPIYMNDCVYAFIVAIIAGFVFGCTILARFISALSAVVYQKSLLKLLLKDPTTGGNNLLAFEQFAEKNLRNKRKYAYAIVDFSLLRYQNYCTLYGMSEGERLIYKLEKILNGHLGKGEYVAKVNSSDFVLVLRGKGDSPYTETFLNRINKIYDEIPTELKTSKRGGPSPRGLSNIILKGGIYVVDPVTDNVTKAKRIEQSKNIDQLYMKAGIAKQTLSEDGGVMLYNHDMWEKELWEQKVEDTMRHALENGEFHVYIQPKYHPSTEQLMGGEALVRWISPTEGFISPGMFIPIFEKNGFVTQLDDYMISNTARLQAQWLAEGKNIVPISVNVSRIHFSQPDLAEHIRDLVDQYSLPRHFIEIELTESAFFDDKKALISTVNRLQEYGFEVSMDDFGSGYSSLNSLKDLPLNVLKLDAEFFRGDDFDSRGEVVVSEAISLAKQLNMRIVAEGVEKKEQVEFLAKHDCDMIQGYYFAKPMPADEYESRM